MTEIKEESTVTKSTIEQYSIHVPHYGFAIISIDDKVGLLQIHSDYGDYQYRWNAPGKPFKQFIIDLDKDHHYLMEKISGYKQWFDAEATNKVCKKEIIKARLGKCEINNFERIDKQEARSAMNDLDELNSKNIDTWCTELMYSDGLRKVFSYDGDWSGVPLVTDWEPQLRMFIKHIWPVFISYLRKEIDEH